MKWVRVRLVHFICSYNFTMKELNFLSPTIYDHIKNWFENEKKAIFDDVVSGTIKAVVNI